MPIRFSFFVRAMAYIAFAFAASAQDTQSIECPSAAPPTQQLTEGEIRARALQALGCNVTKYKNILYDAEDRTEFTGHAGGGMSLDGPAPEVKTWTPALRSHFEIVNGKPTNVLDGWEDQAPFENKSSLTQRTQASRSTMNTGELATAFLDAGRAITLIGVRNDQGHRA